MAAGDTVKCARFWTMPQGRQLACQSCSAAPIAVGSHQPALRVVTAGRCAAAKVHHYQKENRRGDRSALSDLEGRAGRVSDPCDGGAAAARGRWDISWTRSIVGRMLNSASNEHHVDEQ
jgi:hypothetical protein